MSTILNNSYYACACLICYSVKMDLLTNATVVDDAIKFVSSKSKENLKSSTEGDQEESKEPDYDEIKIS
jgi:hypothetical protein